MTEYMSCNFDSITRQEIALTLKHDKKQQWSNYMTGKSFDLITWHEIALVALHDKQKKH